MHTSHYLIIKTYRSLSSLSTYYKSLFISESSIYNSDIIVRSLREKR